MPKPKGYKGPQYKGKHMSTYEEIARKAGIPEKEIEITMNKIRGNTYSKKYI